MKKITPLIIAFIAFIIPFQAGAMCPITNTVMSALAALKNVEASAKYVTGEITSETKEQQAEAVRSPDCKSASKSDLEIKTTVYDLIESTILTNPDKSDIITKQTSYDAAVLAIKSTFFDGYDDGSAAETDTSSISGIASAVVDTVSSALSSDGSTERAAEVILNRKKYVNDVASSYVALGIQLRNTLLGDTKSVITAATSGCDRLSGYELQNSNLFALIKASTADVAVQIMLLEAQASQALLKESVGLVKFNPAWSKDNPDASVLDDVNETVNSGDIKKDTGTIVMFNTYFRKDAHV